MCCQDINVFFCLYFIKYLNFRFFFLRIVIRLVTFSMDAIKQRTLCRTCKRNIGQFKCESCRENFCIEHVTAHQQELNQQLEEILNQHRICKQTIEKNRIEYQSIIDSIEQWERTSIETIQRVANEVRLKLENENNLGKTIFNELNNLTRQIRQIQQENGLFERDLRTWKISIEKVENYLKNTIVPNRIIDDQTKPLIYKLQIVPKFSEKSIIEEDHYYQLEPVASLASERFFHCHGNARIADDGQVVINGSASFFGTEIRGIREYSDGQHDVRLQIENNPSKIWIFIGIISKTQRMGGNLFTSSSVYGWGDYHDYFLAGHRQNSSSEVLRTHTLEEDIIKLSIDCQKRFIRYTNERNQKTEKLSIDLVKCPFPWQLYLSLGGKDDRIRLLNTLAFF